MTRRIKYSLRLKPINGAITKGLHTTDHDDEYPDSCDANMPQPFSSALNSSNDQPSMPDSISELSDSPEQRVIKVDELVIHETEHGFNILESNEHTTLKEGDIITVGKTYFQVHIMSEAIVEYQGPQRRYDFDTLNPSQHDSWAQPTEHNLHQANRNDPFLTANSPTISGHSSAPTTIHDPLSFLYSGIEQRAGHHPLDHHNQAPEVLRTHSTVALSQGLSIDAHSHYTPACTHNKSSQPSYEPGLTAPAGNILNDLGINSARNSTILSGRYGQSGKTLDEKSPMDMLDEYLDEPGTSNLPVQASAHNTFTYAAPGPLYHNTTPEESITRSIKGMFKKLIS